MTALALLFLLARPDELPPLGTNLAGVADWATEWPFVDAMKGARSWISQKEGAEWGMGGPLETDSAGNVKSLQPGQYAETVLFSNGHHPLGQFTLTWQGKGQFEGDLGTSVKDLAPGKASVETPKDKPVFLKLTQVDPSDPPLDLHLFMPGFDATSEPFHPIFSQRMSLYRCLRFMDWQTTNDSPLTKWSDRPLPNDVTFTRKGVPLETIIDLAKSKNAIPWLCVPHLADDEFVRNMAKLVKDRLSPQLKVAVEYSNECWNTQFAQGRWCQEQGRKLGLADDAKTAGLRFYSRRSVEVFRIFEDVFQGHDRLVRVLSAQAADSLTGKEVVGWENAYRHADALAIAPYLGGSLGSPEQSGDTKAGGLDGLFATLKAQVQGPVKGWVEASAATARANGLNLVAYEGGQHLVGTGPAQDDTALNDLFDQANRDSRMRDAYLQFLKVWRSSGGSLFVHYTDCAPFSKYGRWGALEYQDQDPQTSWKNQALIQYALFPDRQ